MAVVACRTREKQRVTQLEGKSYRGTEAESHDGVEVSKLKEKELGEGSHPSRPTCSPSGHSLSPSPPLGA